MKNAKRWLAVILAVTLLGSNAVYQLGTTLSANETEAVTESQQDESENAVAEQAEKQQEDTGKATVQEVTPQEDKSDASAQESKPVQEEQQTKETQTESQTPAVVEAPQAEQTQEAAPANAGQSEAEAQAETPVAQTYDVKINKPDLDGGQIKVWGTDGIQTDVTSYDGNNQYVKEVTEGEDFNFQITRNDGFEIENVTVNGAQIAPESTDGNVSTYKLSGVAEEKAIIITYNKVETPTEENQDGEVAADEGQKDDAVTEQGGQQSDDKVNTASLNDAKETAETHEDTDTEKWITVGKSVTLSNEYISNRWTTYSHSWKIKKGKDVVSINASNSNSISVKGKKAGEATITDTIAWNSYWDGQQEKTITYTIHVSEAVAPTAITITGANEVTQFKNINLTYTLTPAGAEGTVQWSSSNEDILTVDSSGKVTGLRRGQATVTANVYSGQSLLCSATKTIQVVEDTTVTGESATVYYLLDPTKDANSNDTGNWGPAYGTAKVNVTGATWTGGKNCFDNVDQRVVSWPNGTNVVTRDSDAWDQIFNNYKSSVEQQLGVTITKDDVVSITLRPAKISRNNGTNPDKHLDCNVDVNCKGVSIVHYYLLDKSSDPNSTEYVHQGSKSYINGNKTNPETVTGKSFPTTKTGTDGATYTFSGWYTDQELTQPATFPYTVNSNVSFYAKYVAGRQVVYNLNGGSFSDGSSLTEKHNEGENVVVKSEPTRKGYKFTGWTVEGLDGVSSIDSGASFQMPNNNVTITANWEEQKIEDFVTLTPTDVTEVYNGEAHAAGTAKVAGKAEGADVSDLKIEYQKADGSWTDNPAEITATNVSDSKTVKVRVSSEGKYTGTLTTEEKLTITRRPVTVTANSYQKTFGETDPEFTAKVKGTLGNDKVDYKLSREKGEDVGGYAITPAGEEKQGNYKVTYKPGTLTIIAAQRATELGVTSYDGVYDAKKHTITVNGTVDGDKVEYSYDGGKTWVTDLKEYKNVTKGSVAIQVKITNKNYTPAETILSGSVTITPATLTITTPKAEKVYDGNALTAEGSITGFVNGETATFVTTGSQTEVGNSKNTYTLTWDGTAKETNYTVSDSVGTLKVTKQSIVPDPDNPESYKDVTIDDPSDATYDGKEHKWTPVVTDKDGNELKEGTDYEVSYNKDDFTNVTGEIKVTITGKGNYTGTVDKTYQITPKAVIITTDSDTRVFNDQPLTAPGRVDGIVAGETYGFTVTGTQTYVGSSANSYQMTWAKKGENKYTAKKSNYKVEENIGTLTVTDGTPENPVTPSLVVNKTHDTDKTYKAGDVITFTITVKNIYDEAKTITLEEQEGVTLDKTTFENVKPGKEITATATYKVTEADIVNGTFTNNVKATFSGVDKEYTGTDTVDKFEESRPHMTITKVTKDAGKDHIYKLGETINYVITVKNDGNLTLTNVKIEDALTGNAGENAWTIDTFAPGETQTFEASYVVTEADVIAGKVVNNATGEAENPDPKKEETPVTPGEKEDPVETPNPGLTVIKTSDKTGEVKLGDKITYTITVTNNGNVTISGVKLNDSLTGDNWTLGDIKPGEIVTRTTTYTVTEADILAGKIENHATATGKDPSGNEVTDEGEKTVTTEPSKPHITVTKETTSTPKNGETYALGEKITYKITAKNTGNLTLKDVVVSDELTGNTGDKAFKIDGEFKPGDEKTFETSYTVTEADLGKTVVNVATATGKTPDPDKPKPDVDPGKKEDPTDQKKPSMSIEKKVIDQKEKYEIGDTVKYEITVTNTGNTTQNNILVEDQMSAAGQAVITKVDGANGTIDGAKVTLDTLAPGKAATITAEYTVVKADRGNKIINVAVAKGEGEIPKTPEVPVQVEEVYDIHVVHAFAPGNEGNVALPDDYTIENLKPKTVKSLMAKGVTGYVAYPAVQNATVVDRDITVTFLYYKDEIGTDPTNPDKPDGVPDEFQRVVRFVAVNGTVSIDHAVVTLFGEDGKPAKNGVGHLSALQIAAATANAGYNQASLSWAPQAPTMDYNITGDMTFTATFTATPVTPPATPDNPRPNNPTRPSGQTTESTGNAFVDNVVTPVVETVKEKAAKIQEVFNSDDEDVPLADQNLDNHKCCILHFLIMLITLLVYALATKSMKKRQKKLHEVREELDCELARRGLPLSREKE